MVEEWPYLDVPVYVVCTRDGEGHSQILHRNYLLHISSNLGQAEEDVAGVEHTNMSAPAPSVDTEPAGSEPSGMATSDTTSNTSQGSHEQPAPIRCGTCSTQNQLPWRYQNFALLQMPACLASWMHGLVWVFVSI